MEGATGFKGTLVLNTNNPNLFLIGERFGFVPYLNKL